MAVIRLRPCEMGAGVNNLLWWPSNRSLSGSASRRMRQAKTDGPRRCVAVLTELLSQSEQGILFWGGGGLVIQSRTAQVFAVD